MGENFNKSFTVSFGTSVTGLGFLLGVVSLCLRSTLGIMPLFAAADYPTLFIACFAGSALITGIAMVLRPQKFSLAGVGKKHPTSPFLSPSIIIATTCCVLGAAGAFLAVPYPLVAAVLCGLLLGVGCACSLTVWLTRFSTFSWGYILLGLTFSFLLASILWWLSLSIIEPVSRCAFFAAAILLACVFLCLNSYTSYTCTPISSAETRTPTPAFLTPAAETSTPMAPAVPSGRITPNRTDVSPYTAISVENSVAFNSKLAPESHTLKSFLKQGWAAFAILIFNLFILGLTFLPENAGVDGGANFPHKLIAYVVTCIIAWLVMKHITKKPTDTPRILGILYHASLPIAAAIMLVFPFLDNLMAPALMETLGSVSYLGIAWGNVLGLVVFVFFIKQNCACAPKFCGLLLSGCALGFCAGAIIFALLGHSAQIVSLCVLAIYLTALVISELLSNSRWSSSTDTLGNTPKAATSENLQTDGLLNSAQSGLTAQRAVANPTGAVVSTTSATSTLSGSSHASVSLASVATTPYAVAVSSPPPAVYAQDASIASNQAIAGISDAIAKQYGLSERETEVFQYLARGRSAKYIAEQLFISPETVRTHTRRIYTKTGVHTREELLSFIEHYEV